MTIIEGIGDEVIHFFIGLLVVVIGTIAWWTTSISEQRYIRTAVLLERRRHRAHRRLTNHTETVTIVEASTISAITPSEEQRSGEEASAEVPANSNQTANIKPEDSSVQGTLVSIQQSESNTFQLAGEEQNIIETMDADANILRQRRPPGWLLNTLNSELSTSTSTSEEHERITEGSSTSNNLSNPPCTTVLSLPGEHQDASSSQLSSSNPNTDLPKPKPSAPIKEFLSSGPVREEIEGDNAGITIKLKLITDELKLVEGKLNESLGDFKKRHFLPEISANKIIRLIFNGQVLQPDTQTLKNCGLFDNCVVHCLIHQKRNQPSDPNVIESRRDGYSFPNPNVGNNNNQNRDWDLGNFLFAFISFTLLAAWYFRYVYAHLYTVTATVGLILITGIFTIVLVGMYFPDYEQYPNPTFHIRERTQQE